MDSRQRYVEIALGYRVRKIGENRYRCEMLSPDAMSVVRVCPAGLREFEMFRMLCTPDSEWPTQ